MIACRSNREKFIIYKKVSKLIFFKVKAVKLNFQINISLFVINLTLNTAYIHLCQMLKHTAFTHRCMIISHLMAINWLKIWNGVLYTVLDITTSNA